MALLSAGFGGGFYRFNLVLNRGLQFRRGRGAYWAARSTGTICPNAVFAQCGTASQEVPERRQSRRLFCIVFLPSGDRRRGGLADLIRDDAEPRPVSTGQAADLNRHSASIEPNGSATSCYASSMSTYGRR